MCFCNILSHRERHVPFTLHTGSQSFPTRKVAGLPVALVDNLVDHLSMVTNSDFKP